MPRPAPAHHTPHRLTAAVRLLASGSALAAAVAGIPYVLCATAGVPWPSQVTSFNDLATRLEQPISDPFVFQALALVGWACWAYFTATVLREALWLLRCLPTLARDATLLRRRTATLPAHRAAAALLVGTLLIALIGMWRLPVAHATTNATSPAAPVATVAPLHVPPARAAEPEHATYIVQPGDTLWDIAEQHLGDPCAGRRSTNSAAPSGNPMARYSPPLTTSNRAGDCIYSSTTRPHPARRCRPSKPLHRTQAHRLRNLSPRNISPQAAGDTETSSGRGTVSSRTARAANIAR